MNVLKLASIAIFFFFLKFKIIGANSELSILKAKKEL